MRDDIREKILDVLFAANKTGNAYVTGNNKDFWTGDRFWTILPKPYGWRVSPYIWKEQLVPLFHQCQCDTGIMRCM